MIVVYIVAIPICLVIIALLLRWFQRRSLKRHKLEPVTIAVDGNAAVTTTVKTQVNPKATKKGNQCNEADFKVCYKYYVRACARIIYNHINFIEQYSSHESSTQYNGKLEMHLIQNCRTVGLSDSDGEEEEEEEGSDESSEGSEGDVEEGVAPPRSSNTIHNLPAIVLSLLVIYQRLLNCSHGEAIVLRESIHSLLVSTGSDSRKNKGRTAPTTTTHPSLTDGDFLNSYVALARYLCEVPESEDVIQARVKLFGLNPPVVPLRSPPPATLLVSNASIAMLVNTALQWNNDGADKVSSPSRMSVKQNGSVSLARMNLFKSLDIPADRVTSTSNLTTNVIRTSLQCHLGNTNRQRATLDWVTGHLKRIYQRIMRSSSSSSSSTKGSSNFQPLKVARPFTAPFGITYQGLYRVLPTLDSISIGILESGGTTVLRFKLNNQAQLDTDVYYFSIIMPPVVGKHDSSGMSKRIASSFVKWQSKCGGVTREVRDAVVVFPDVAIHQVSTAIRSILEEDFKRRTKASAAAVLPASSTRPNKERLVLTELNNFRLMFDGEVIDETDLRETLASSSSASSGNQADRTLVLDRPFFFSVSLSSFAPGTHKLIRDMPLYIGYISGPPPYNEE